MKYFKMINDNSFIGAIHSGQFVAQSPDKPKLFYANELTGQFVSYQGTLYRDYWMVAIENPLFPFEIVTITEITEEEYIAIMEAIHNNETIDIDDDEEEEPVEPIIEPELDETVEFVRAAKIKEMSSTCRQTIEAGFNLDLRGETRHFSLTMQDQLNLMSLSIMAQTQELIPYHADGEETTFYTNNEINMIIQAATELKVYNTTYYNALKTYINSLETIEEISAITYGTPIPDEYKTDVLKTLE